MLLDLLTNREKTSKVQCVMKKGLHPKNYRPVVFQDVEVDFAFLTRSTAKTDETIKWEDGNEYPLVRVHISSASHPFYTGKEKLLDIEGRVDRFKAKAKRAEEFRKQVAARSKSKKQSTQKSKKVESVDKNKDTKAKEETAPKSDSSADS